MQISHVDCEIIENVDVIIIIKKIGFILYDLKKVERLSYGIYDLYSIALSFLFVLFVCSTLFRVCLMYLLFCKPIFLQ